MRTPRAGGERPGATSGQLHVMSLEGGEARCVTDLPLGVSDPRFLPDGRRVVVVAGVLEEAIDKPAPADKGGVVEATRALLEARAKSRVRAHVTESRVYRFWDHWLTDGAVPHLFLVDLDSGSVRDLTPTSRRWFDLMEDPGQYDVSADGRHVVFAANRSAPPHRETRWSIFEVAVDGDGEVRELTPDVPADASLPRYSPDGRSVLFGQRRDDYYGDRIRLRLLDRATLATEVLTEDWDRSPTEWCFRDDGSIVGCVEEEARGAVFELRRGEAPASSAARAPHTASSSPDRGCSCSTPRCRGRPRSPRSSTARRGCSPTSTIRSCRGALSRPWRTCDSRARTATRCRCGC